MQVRVIAGEMVRMMMMMMVDLLLKLDEPGNPPGRIFRLRAFYVSA